jgi:hypothetical protein
MLKEINEAVLKSQKWTYILYNKILYYIFIRENTYNTIDNS